MRELNKRSTELPSIKDLKMEKTTIETLSIKLKPSEIFPYEVSLKESGYIKFEDYFIFGTGNTRTIHILR